MKIKCTTLLGLSLSLSLLANAQKKTFYNCINLDPISIGKLTFTVNELQANPDPAHPNTYPVDYKIIVYHKGKQDTTFQLKKGTSDVVVVKLDPSSKGNYCLQVHRRTSLISHKQIHWTEEHDMQASLKVLNTPVFYASESKQKLYLFGRTITSKNGTGGDGVKVLID